MNWYVVYTKPKWEKKVANQLNKIGVNCYCPTITKTIQWSDRKKKQEVVLFNHYVFVQLEEKMRNLVFQSPGAVRYLYWLGKHAIVRDEEINTIKEWLSKKDITTISVSKYEVGETIIIENGPFSEQSAVIKDITKTHYVLVLKSLGCILKMKVS